MSLTEELADAIELVQHRAKVAAAHEARLAALEKKVSALMSRETDLEKNVADIATATDTIAAEVTAQQAQIAALLAADNPTPAQIDAVNSALSGIAARLKSIGTPATPAGNVPPNAPTPPAPVGP